ncbi:hypothetical protein FALCPG4_015642 [Fusarium falciforme]
MIETSGTLVARIIADKRTVNKRVMANGGDLSLDKIHDMVKRSTGKVPERRHVGAAARAAVRSIKSDQGPNLI